MRMAHIISLVRTESGRLFCTHSRHGVTQLAAKTRYHCAPCCMGEQYLFEWKATWCSLPHRDSMLPAGRHLTFSNEKQGYQNCDESEVIFNNFKTNMTEAKDGSNGMVELAWAKPSPKFFIRLVWLRIYFCRRLCPMVTVPRGV